SLSGQRRGAVLDNALTAILSGQRSIKLVAFDMAPVALCVADGARTMVRGVDLKATLGDLQMASTRAMSYMRYVDSSTSCPPDAHTIQERTLLARLLREEFILRCVAPREVQGEFTSHEFNKDGKLVLQNSRYKTRVRASQTTRVVVNYTNNESAYGRATKTHGRRSEIKLKHKGGGDRTIASISVIGAQSRTNAERARDEFVLDVCCGRKPGLQSFAFLRHMFFPVAEELAGEVPGSLRRREIYGLNLSQSEVVAGMVHSPRPCTVVHGPPGTGKTKTISAAVEVWAKHGKPTWAVAHSNVAVKNIAEGVARRGVDFRLIVSQDFYVEWHEALYELIEDKLIRSDEFPATTRELKMMMGDACVILSTVSMLSNPKLHQLRMFTDVMPVERLVIDEASQINVFEFMVRISRFVMTVHGRVPLVAKFSKISKICFFGDPKQRAWPLRNNCVHESLTFHLVPPYGKDDAPTIQCIFDLSHLNRYSHFLDTQYRMPIPLGNFISRYVYGGRLKSEHRIDDYSCIAFVDARKQSGKEDLGRSKIVSSRLLRASECPIALMNVLLR
ncbi:P-loop containing nucleoside triphosphate hydrolase protein, partial [Schizophyllum commune]